jgi:hypothetical protein
LQETPSSEIPSGLAKSNFFPKSELQLKITFHHELGFNFLKLEFILFGLASVDAFLSPDHAMAKNMEKRMK